MAIYKYKLPELGEGLFEGEVVKWHIKPGDMIEEDQIIMDVQNDKSVVEVPSPVNGKVLELKVAEGTVSVVGDVLATIEVEGEVEADGDQSNAEADVAASDRLCCTSPASRSSTAVPVVQRKAAVPASCTTVSKQSGKVLATPSITKIRA